MSKYPILHVTEETTPQEIFDAAVKHMRTQGVPCLDDEGICVYRHGSLACAVGAFLTDEEAKRADDSGGLAADDAIDLVEAERLTPHVGLLLWLQEDHDNELGDSCLDFEAEIKETAAHFDLTYKEPA